MLAELGGADRTAGGMRKNCFVAPSSLRRMDASKANLGAGARPTGTAGGSACELLDEIFAEEPDGVGHWNLKAATLGRLGEFEEANRALRAGSGAPPEAAARVAKLRSYAEDCRAPGRGIAAYRRAIALDPALGEAWWSLANLKTVKFDEADLRRYGSAPRGSGPKSTRTGCTSILRSARRCTSRTAQTRRLLIMRGKRASSPMASLHRSDRSAQTVDRCIELFTADLSRRGRMRSTRSDLHRRHAARRIHPGRADPVVAQPGRRHVGTARHPVLAREAAANIRAWTSRLPRTTGGGLARNISGVRASSGGRSARSSSTSCRTTGCSCRSSS